MAGPAPAARGGRWRAPRSAIDRSSAPRGPAPAELEALLAPIREAYGGDLHSVDPLQSSGDKADEYGEVLPSSVVKMFREAEARPGQRFYDLGSGAGKATAIMWRLGLHATGVELNAARWNASRAAVSRLRALACSGLLQEAGRRQLRFVRASCLDLDLSDADLIWSSVSNDAALHDALTYSLAACRSGARVVSAYPLKRSPSFSAATGCPRREVFRLLRKFRVATTWAKRGGSTLFLHERVGPPIVTRRLRRLSPDAHEVASLM